MRFRWKPNNTAIRGNRSAQHYAQMGRLPTYRKMERAGIIGDMRFLARLMQGRRK